MTPDDLADIEAIKQLKYRYLRTLDQFYKGEKKKKFVTDDDSRKMPCWSVEPLSNWMGGGARRWSTA